MSRAGIVGRGAARGIWWLVIELVVVFVGVYAAFVLDDYREQGRVETKKAQVHAALLEEFESHEAALDTIMPFLETLVTEFEDGHEAGDMPRPNPIHLVLGVRRGLWDAVLQAGGLEVLDVGVMYRINTYYVVASFVGREMDRLTALSDQLVLPVADSGIEEFYDIKSRRLKRKYRWYLDTLVALRSHVAMLHDMTGGVVVGLRPPTAPGE